MKMVKNFALIVGLFLLVSGSAWGFSAVDHVSTAPNGKGDVLIFPVYFTGGGWDTKLTVVNTSLTRCVVAKVVFRSAGRSQELRDFFIYLSPTDVWTGTLTLNSADNLPHITSTDSSCLNVSGDFASAAAPLDINLENACVGDTNMIGYVETIQAASFNLGPPKVSKAAIKTAYDAWVAAGAPVGTNNPINVMIGQTDIVNTLNGQAYNLNATALKNYDSTEGMTVTRETLLGNNARNDVMEIESALSKNNIAIPYYAGSKGFVFSTFTFPTKMAGFPCGTAAWRGRYAGFPSPVFTLNAFDLDENTFEITPNFSPIVITTNTFPNEVNFIQATDLPGNFEEGWFLVNLTAGPTAGLAQDAVTTLSYTGAPVIASSMRFNASGQGGWLYNAYDLGAVTVNGALDMQYNYFGQTDF
jgi:hypothetical protein